MFKKIKEDGEAGIQIVRKKARSLFYRSLEEMDTVKVRLEIRKLERELEEFYLEAGKLIFERFQKGSALREEEPELSSLYSKAARLMNEQEMLKAELAERLKPSWKDHPP